MRTGRKLKVFFSYVGVLFTARSSLPAFPNPIFARLFLLLRFFESSHSFILALDRMRLKLVICREVRSYLVNESVHSGAAFCQRMKSWMGALKFIFKKRVKIWTDTKDLSYLRDWSVLSFLHASEIWRCMISKKWSVGVINRSPTVSIKYD